MNWFQTPDWKDDDEYDHKINQDFVDQAIRRAVSELDDAARVILHRIDDLRDVAEAAHHYRLTDQDARDMMQILDHFTARTRSSTESAGRDVDHLCQRLWDHYRTVP